MGGVSQWGGGGGVGGGGGGGVGWDGVRWGGVYVYIYIYIYVFVESPFWLLVSLPKKWNDFLSIKLE